MNPETIHLQRMAEELAEANRSARREALMAAAPFLMAAIGWSAIRKQRRAVMARLAQLEIEAQAVDVDPAPPAEEPEIGEQPAT